MDTGFFGQLQEIVGAGNCFANEKMCNHTTFRTGGPAEYYVQPAKEQVFPVVRLCKTYGIPWQVIGNGSNLLVGDGGVKGLVLEIGKQMADVSIEQDRIRAGAGALLAYVSNCAASHGLSGLEFAGGIPGSVGGAVVMNAGAYGGEIKDVIRSASVLAPEGEVIGLTPEQLGLGYRTSCIQENGYIVLEAEFQLEACETAEIAAKMSGLREQRMAKQPLEYPSAGSTFKRPIGHFAGRLIEEAGLRGLRIGDAQVSEKHCGFVVNRGNATSAQIRQLISEIQDRVESESGIRLETEVKLMGEF